MSAHWLPMLSTPSSLVAAAAEAWGSGDAWALLRVSVWRVSVALLLGGAVGVALGALNGLSRTAGNVLDAGVRMLRGVAVLGCIPLLLLSAGAIGETKEGAMLGLLAVGAFFPVYAAAFQGVRGVDATLIELGRAAGLARWPLLRDVILPGALPSLLSGLRLALVLLWGLLLGVEAIRTLAAHPDGSAAVDRIVLTFLIYAVLAQAADRLLSAWSRHASRWSRARPAAGAY